MSPLRKKEGKSHIVSTNYLEVVKGGSRQGKIATRVMFAFQHKSGYLPTFLSYRKCLQATAVRNSIIFFLPDTKKEPSRRVKCSNQYTTITLR